MYILIMLSGRSDTPVVLGNSRSDTVYALIVVISQSGNRDHGLVIPLLSSETCSKNEVVKSYDAQLQLALFPF